MMSLSSVEQAAHVVEQFLAWARAYNAAWYDLIVRPHMVVMVATLEAVIVAHEQGTSCECSAGVDAVAVLYVFAVSAGLPDAAAVFQALYEVFCESSSGFFPVNEVSPR